MKLLIVESPAKANKITKFLNGGYIVKASYGHIRTLKKKNMGIDIKNNFEPSYEIIKNKSNKIKELKKIKDKCNEVILATDGDREGHAIAWHIACVLNLDIKNTKRIIFYEITKPAILKALENPLRIDINQVNSQQARCVLDKLVGFKLSPLLWKNIKNGLSAGRVQSVTLKLIHERDNKIKNKNIDTYFKINSYFNNGIISTLIENKNENETKKIQNEDTCKNILSKCGSKKSKYIIENIKFYNKKNKPPPPFTTSTLQQSAGKAYNLSSKVIMNIAQKLYEKGKITYHRTDSISLSSKCINDVEKWILNNHGKEYIDIRKWKTKNANAQEAHEAIRPTNINVDNIKSSNNLEQKIYNLIWKRTIASQMSCELAKVMEILISCDDKYHFISKYEKTIFQGYKILYNENEKDEISKYEFLKQGDQLIMTKLTGTETLEKQLCRFNEPQLVKKMEQKGIGRPSTYANTIDILQKRGYVIKNNIQLPDTKYKIFSIENGKEIQTQNETKKGKLEKNKLIITDLGSDVISYLQTHFDNIMNYDFTSNMENNLDNISKGDIEWHKVVETYFNTFNPIVEKLKNQSKITKTKDKYNRLIGKTENGQEIYACNAKYGPVLRIGCDKKCRFIGLPKKTNINNVVYNDIKHLLKYPVNLGKYENKDVLLKNGKYGEYYNYSGKNYSIKKYKCNGGIGDFIKMMDKK